MIEDENSDIAKDNAKENFESLSMMVVETAREYIAGANGLARAVKHHGVEIESEEICRRIIKAPRRFCF